MKNMNVQKALLTKVGGWSFIVGSIIAIVLGLFARLMVPQWQAILLGILSILGLLVGFFNVNASETKQYLIAAIALVLVASQGSFTLSTIPYIGVYLTNIFVTLLAFIAPATVVVALKAIYYIAKDE